MKKTYFLITLILSLTVLAFSCKKHNIQPVDQLSLLPPATQTGARTFGCLVNGQAFVPNNRSIIEGPDLQCNYIFITGGYYFTVGASKHNNDDGSDTGLVITTDSLSISQGQAVRLTSSFMHGTYGFGGTAGAAYNIFAPAGIYNYYTSANLNGELRITTLDTVKQIVSGTFYFNVLDHNGDTLKITDGRFDMPYTR